MSGFVQGFQGGFNMADGVIRQEENKRRYGLQQDRLDRAEQREIDRYDKAQARQGKLDAMSEQLHNIQVEQSEYSKSQRPILEERAKEQHESLMANQELTRKNMALQIKERRKKMKMEDVREWNGIAYQEFIENGSLSEQTADGYLKATAGTPFELDYILDPNVQKSLDALDQYARSGFQDTNSQEVIGHFNTVFKQDINRLMVHPQGSAYNKVTGVDIGKDGQMSFEVTAYGQNGKPLETRNYGNVLNYSDVVDKAFGRKAVAAAMNADPKFRAQLIHANQSSKSRGQAGDLDYLTKNNVSQVQRLYQDIVQNAAKEKKAIREKYADPMAINLDPTKMQAELDAVDVLTQQNIQGLHDTFTPQEVQFARIPSAVANKGIGQADPNAQKQSALDSLNQHLKNKGLTPVTVEGE